jgi:hypothetical protein
MSLVYKCDFYTSNMTTNPDGYPYQRVVRIENVEINGVPCEIKLGIELEIPAISDRIHVSGAAWKDTAQLLKDWLDATFP